MATKKNKKQEVSLPEKELISSEQVWDVLRFASNIYAGVYNPYLANATLKNASLSPQLASSEKIEEALRTPENSENELVGMSEFLSLTSAMYNRILLYIANMLSFDLTYVPLGDLEDKDYKSKRYKEDKKILEDFLDRFDVKKEFGLAMRQMLRNEAYFCVLRNDSERYTLQELNHNYCLITGKFSHGFLFDFDFSYFLNAGIDINSFPSIFKKIYIKIFGGKNSSLDYRPSAKINQRTGTWAYWSQMSPDTGAWVFKFQPEIAARIPFFASMFPDLILQPLIRGLQTNSMIAAASKILVGSIPMLKDLKGGAVKDSISISPDVLGKFLAVLKAGLGDAVKVGAAPLENISAHSFPMDKNFYEEYLQTTAATSGVNSRLIFTQDRQNAIESQLGINVDEYMTQMVYPMFSDFLEFHINRLTKKYKFRVFFEGTNFFTNRKERLETQTKLMDFGIINHQKIAASIGQLPHHFEKQLKMTKSLDFVKNLTPITKANQMPKEGASGRPLKDSGELSDSGSDTRDAGSNIEKGGEE